MIKRVVAAVLLLGALVWSSHEVLAIKTGPCADNCTGMVFSGGNAAGAATTTWSSSSSLTNTNITLSNGNLTATNTQSGGDQVVRSVASHSSGKFYAEVTIGTQVANTEVGFANATFSVTSTLGVTDANGLGYATDGNVWFNSSSHPTCSPVAGFANGDVLGVAIDMGNNAIWMRKNGGNWNNSGTANPATNTGGCVYSPGTNAGPYFFAANFAGAVNDALTVNFGATAYGTAAPSGFGNW